MVKDVELRPREFDSTIDKKKENDAVVAGQSSHSESGKISKNTINIFDKIFDNFFLLRCFSISRSQSIFRKRSQKSPKRSRETQPLNELIFKGRILGPRVMNLVNEEKMITDVV